MIAVLSPPTMIWPPAINSEALHGLYAQFYCFFGNAINSGYFAAALVSRSPRSPHRRVSSSHQALTQNSEALQTRGLNHVGNLAFSVDFIAAWKGAIDRFLKGCPVPF
jgi:hypothetical protein